MSSDRYFLRLVAGVVFILAAVFLFLVPAISTTVCLGLIAAGLAAWALS